MKTPWVISIVIVLVFCVSDSRAGFAEQASIPGVFMSQFVDREVVLDSSRAFEKPEDAAHLIEKYIVSVNPRRDNKSPKDISTKELAHRIAGVSYCFSIDPFVYAALIRMESINFNQRSVSPTGASGFTQFTSAAIKEVSDQLGLRGQKNANKSTINYFNRIITGTCLEEMGGFKHAGDRYVPLWDLKPAKLLKKGSDEQALQMAKMLKSNPEYALIYGAIVLKVYFSLVENGHQTGCYTYKTGGPVTMKEKIRETVMAYNGDGFATQIIYQSRILDKYYPAIVGTPVY